jgi:hypothetical protein
MKVTASLLPVEIYYLDSVYTTKMLKCTYSRWNVLYKVALPSVISPVSQCWIAREGLAWKPVLGQCSDPELLGAILQALQAVEAPPTIVLKRKIRARLISA